MDGGLLIGVVRCDPSTKTASIPVVILLADRYPPIPIPFILNPPVGVTFAVLPFVCPSGVVLRLSHRGQDITVQLYPLLYPQQPVTVEIYGGWRVCRMFHLELLA